MLHRMIVVAGPVLVVAALALAPTEIMGSDVAVDFKKGDMVFVTADRTEFKLGDAILKVLDKGTQFEVTEVKGGWIGGNVDVDGANVLGWIRSNRLSRVSPRSSSAPTELKSKLASNVTAQVSVDSQKDETKANQAKPNGSLAEKFRQMMLEKERAAKQGTKQTSKLPKASLEQTSGAPAKETLSQSTDKLAGTSTTQQPVPPAKTLQTKANQEKVIEKPAQDSALVVAKTPSETEIGPPKQKPGTGTSANPAQAKPATLKVKGPETKAAEQPMKDPVESGSGAPAKRAGEPSSGKEIGEGPEALAEEFSKLLTELRDRKNAKESPKKPEEKKVVSKQAPKPKAAPKSAAPPADQEPTISVLVLRIADDLDEVKSTERIGQLVISGDQFTDRSLRGLQGLTVKSLSIEAVNISNIGLQYVNQVHGVQWLRLWSPGFDDRAPKLLTDLKDLEVLDIEGTAISGTGFADLRGLPKLETLVLGPKVSDATIADLKQLPALRQLDLRACAKLTLACLERLADLKNLKVVWLPRHLRTKGKRALKVTLPGCQVRS